MSDQKNLFIFILFSVAILTLSQYFFQPKPADKPTAPAKQEQVQQQAAAPPSTGTATTKPGAQPATPTTAGAEQPLSRAEALAASPRLKIDSPRLHGSIALKGASLDDLELADYHETVDPKSPEIVLLSPRRSPEPYYVEFGWTAAKDANLAVPDGDTLWHADATTLTPEHPVTLTWDNGQGQRFLRTIALDQNYMFTVTQKVENTGSKPVTLYPFGLVSRHGTPPTLGYYILHEGPVGVLKDKLNDDFTYSKLASKGSFSDTSTGGWLGITDKYWLAALIPDQNETFTASFRHTAGGPYKDVYQVDYLGAALEVAPGGSATTTERLFAGAKIVDLLGRYENDLHIKKFDDAVDWGWFYFLTKPIFKAIDYFNKLLGNFGLAILLLTFCIKVLFLPLAHRSYVSMSAMKKLQPEMMKLRERYGDDKQKLNQEMMQLYKQHKVNPVAGCLPVLLQIPVFFSLYKVLFVTIEMRHAPFYGWVHDLSAQDPTNLFTLFGLIPWSPPAVLSIGLWPILMGTSQFLQQKLNPQPADPVQAKVFMFMPLFMTYILAHFPAGLVIYWTWNNLLSGAQQWFIMRRMGVKA